MKFIDEIIHKLILRMSLKYYPDDKYLIKIIMRPFENMNVKVLDVGCGIGHYSFLFEHYGANVIAFDYNDILIKKANDRKKELNSKVEFLIADGRYPERYFNEKFDIIFLSGFSLFSVNMDKELMENYLSFLDVSGKLIFTHSTNLTGLVRKEKWRNYKVDQLKLFFQSLGCNIEKIYFYDRHIIVKILHCFIFHSFSTKMHILISKITKLPCCLVFIVTR